jgi:putative ABC transport system ATP-binding protein
MSEMAAAAGQRGRITIRNVQKMFFRGKEPVPVLENVNIDIPEGAFIALMGPSGSGKSTLLNIIAGLDRPSAGNISIAGIDMSNMSDSGLARFRAQNIGFIFQSFNLLPVLTAEENVALPLQLLKLPKAERFRRAQVALKIVGLENRMDHYPKQLSGGQEQRVAIARSFVHDPAIIVADEPTGDLDRKSADDILELMEKLNKQFRKTIVMVTHDPEAAARARVTFRLNKGRLVR